MKNQIQVGGVDDKNSKEKLNIKFLESFKTDADGVSRLCSGICIGNVLVRTASYVSYDCSASYHLYVGDSSCMCLA